MEPAHSPPPNDSTSKILYVAIGCGVFLMVGLCVATGVGVWFFASEADEMAASVPVVPYEPPKPPPGLGPMDPQAPPGQGGPALPPPPPAAAAPRIVSATVTAVEGDAPVPVGASCDFNVEQSANPTVPSGYWCRTQIVCGGRLLYGGPNSGYFPCTFSDAPPTVVGRDDETTAADTDAAMSLDTTSQTLTIRDDATSALGAYSVTARVDRTM